MLVSALLVLADPSSEGAEEMTVLVEVDVMYAWRTHSFGPFRAIAAVWGRVAKLIPGEGGQTLIERAQDLVDETDNAWRVLDALARVFDRNAEKR